MAGEATSMTRLLFDRNFEQKLVKTETKSPEPEALPPEPTFSAMQMAEARDQGVAEGRALAMQDIETQTAHTLERLAQSMDQLMRNIGAVQSSLTEESAQIAYLIAARLAPALIARTPLAEIEALVSDCLAAHQRTPRLVVRLNGALVDALQDRIGELTRASGYEGRVVLLEDSQIAPGDCRVEWADGGVERDMKSLMDDIDAAITRFASIKPGQSS